MATPFPGFRFRECNVPAAQTATLKAAWELLSGPVQDAEAAWIAGVDNLTVAAIGSFPASGGGYPTPVPPAGQVIQINENTYTGGSVDGGTP